MCLTKVKILAVLCHGLQGVFAIIYNFRNASAPQTFKASAAASDRRILPPVSMNLASDMSQQCQNFGRALQFATCVYESMRNLRSAFSISNLQGNLKAKPTARHRERVQWRRQLQRSKPAPFPPRRKGCPVRNAGSRTRSGSTLSPLATPPSQRGSRRVRTCDYRVTYFVVFMEPNIAFFFVHTITTRRHDKQNCPPL